MVHSKRNFGLAVGLVLSGAAGASAAPSPVPVSVVAPVTHAFAPLGFDTNDDTQVVVSGYLPNLCYKAPRAEAKVSGKNVSIQVTALLDDTAPFCLQMVVPYLETVSLGVLDRGTYQVEVNAESPYKNVTEITVEESTSSAVDNFVYANVNSVERELGSRTVVLKGYNPSDCFVFDRTEFYSNGKDTFSVLPIMKQVRPHCPKKMVPFAIKAEVPQTLQTAEILLHTRSMNGKSVNILFEN